MYMYNINIICMYVYYIIGTYIFQFTLEKFSTYTETEYVRYMI